MLKKLWLLFFTFAKIAALVVGGGLAMLPVIEDTFVRKKKLLSQEELLDVVALTQTIPGIIAANAAVAVGMKVAGFLGAIAALTGASVNTPFSHHALVSSFASARKFSERRSVPVQRCFPSCRIFGLEPVYIRPFIFAKPVEPPST